MVIVNAIDPDLDSLVYDWITDSRLLIKGARTDDTALYNSPSNAQVFYRSTVTPVSDTAWVQCFVRDRRGGVDVRLIHIILLP